MNNLPRVVRQQQDSQEWNICPSLDRDVLNNVSLLVLLFNNVYCLIGSSTFRNSVTRIWRSPSGIRGTASVEYGNEALEIENQDAKRVPITMPVHFYLATAKHTHGIPVEILSVRPSVCLSNACTVTKRKHLAKKSSIMTNRKSPTSFPISLR